MDKANLHIATELGSSEIQSSPVLNLIHQLMMAVFFSGYHAITLFISTYKMVTVLL
jgi:hypothetical protein